MSTQRVTVWWHKQKKVWCTEIDRKRFTLAKGRANKQQAEVALAALLEERELLASVNGAISVAGLCERFLIDVDEHLARGTFTSYQYACQKLSDALGARLAHTIRPDDIASFSQGLKKSLNDTSRAIVLRTVQRCFNWGVETQLIPPHKLGRIRKPRPRLRDRFLTDQEFAALLRSTNSTRNDRMGAPFRRFLLALDWTGCRPGELARLTWDNVHLERNLALLWKHKTDRTGKPKVIPLILKMRRLLLWLDARRESTHVFLNSRHKPWNRHSIAKRMKVAREKCGLSSDVVPYTLRHRVATNAILRTGDLKMTSALLGHSTVTTTERYVHLANDALIAFSSRALG